jgi:hypothetical protein
MQSGLALPCYAREGELPPSPALHPQNQQQRKNQEQQQNQNQNQNQEQQQNQGRLHRRLDTPDLFFEIAGFCPFYTFVLRSNYGYYFRATSMAPLCLARAPGRCYCADRV